VLGHGSVSAEQLPSFGPDQIERAWDLTKALCRQVKVGGRALDARVAELHLHRPYVGAAFQQMRRERVAQRVRWGGEEFVIATPVGVFAPDSLFLTALARKACSLPTQKPPSHRT
jgi:hypothetical protein